jgi:hypothetical protein
MNDYEHTQGEISHSRFIKYEIKQTFYNLDLTY